MYFSHRVVAGKARLAVAGVAGRGGPALRAAADGEPLQQLAIEAHVELLRPAHALEVVLILPLQPHLDRGTRRRPESRGGSRCRRAIRAADLRSADRPASRAAESRTSRAPGSPAAGRSRAASPDARPTGSARDAPSKSRATSAKLSKLPSAVSSPGSSGFTSTIEREQIANRVVVFRAIETMDGADAARVRAAPPTRDRSRCSSAARHRAIGRRVRTRPSGRRHRAGAQLRDDLLPRLGVPPGASALEGFEVEAAGVQPLAVAADAVPIDQRFRGSGSRRSPDTRRRCGDAAATRSTDTLRVKSSPPASVPPPGLSPFRGHSTVLTAWRIGSIAGSGG